METVPGKVNLLYQVRSCLALQLSPPHGQLSQKGADLPSCSCMLPSSPFAQVLKLIQPLRASSGPKLAENVCTQGTTPAPRTNALQTPWQKARESVKGKGQQ